MILKRFKKMEINFVKLCLLAICVMSCQDSVNNKLNSPKDSLVAVSPNDTQPIYSPQSPEGSLNSFRVPEGYKLELVASEPMIKEPVAISWDGNGRMYVAEMRTYMQDVDGTDTNEPVSRISILEDINSDGKMDKSTVFVDSLLLPRVILALDDRLIVGETYTNNLWSYRDTDGDGKADEKLLIYRNPKNDTRNLEHQRSGLIWNIDNWIYIARSPLRFRFQGNKMVVDTLYDAPESQWGIGKDNYGKLFFSRAGAEIPANGFQIGPKYGSLEMEGQLEEGFEITWPIVRTPDVQGGTFRLREDGSLNHFTAPCGQTVFRGDRLPENMRGDLFICEPVGRMIRRSKITDQKGKIVLKNAYHEQEFITSNDMNFRPVNTATGPDGSLYIVDMYRGIIQESNWTKEGSFLRPVIINHNLDKNIGRGRIYRLVHRDYEPGPTPNLLDLPTKELVEILLHPNGWWRDTAQKLIILRGDKSVVPNLTTLALNEESFVKSLIFWRDRPSSISRVHALWTLEGLGSINTSILVKAFKDKDPNIRKAAIEISEVYLKEGNKEVMEQLIDLQDDTNIDVLKQLVLTLQYTQVNSWESSVDYIMNNNAENEIIRELGTRKLHFGDQWKDLKSKIVNKRSAEKKLILQGAENYSQLCIMCHGKNGKGNQNSNGELLAPPLSGSARVNGDQDILINILLHGLSGPIDGNTYSDIMPSMKSQSDEYIASVLSYIRNDFGNSAKVIDTKTVEKVRSETFKREKYWTLEELLSKK